MEAPPLEPRLVGVVGMGKGIPHEWPHGMQGTALHVHSYIYIYTSFTQYENEAKLVCFG